MNLQNYARWGKNPNVYLRLNSRNGGQTEWQVLGMGGEKGESGCNYQRSTGKMLMVLVLSVSLL